MMINQYKKLKLSMLAGILCGFLLAALAPLAIAQEKIDLKRAISEYRYRQLYMGTKASHNLAIRLLVTQKLYLFEHIEMHASALSDMAEIMPRLFEKTQIVTTSESRALPKIWKSNGEVSEEFMAAAASMQKEAMRLKDVSKDGNIAKITKQSKVLARNCQSCHNIFRGE